MVYDSMLGAYPLIRKFRSNIPISINFNLL
jgi:hypothetical protein